jgi:DNA-binding response OmpR family regulator
MTKSKTIGKGIKIFILEDERDIRVYGKEFFIRRGFDTYTALTGKAAINIIKRIKPQIAILDIYLEGEVNGLEVLKFIKENQPGCFCIMVTKEDDVEINQKARELGAFDYLTKPIKIKELYSIIQRIVGKIRKEAKRDG